ncbi:MAG TPA: RNA polymerase sigma-70 factor [Chitinophaga sp.]|uniref:RNA polymerase sigma-70 factor n=1 Tax=Chitinophaga sp. TaxID=1869181 RepID=UPI002CD3256B|nr:RNA polymerase sigma-70 factor [Chitinophaga sp.]HVI44597.1 RNA polymerase sigma-70 factor [Chitinophaga sp.]
MVRPISEPAGFSVPALRRGDQAAFHALFLQFYAPLCYFTERLTGDREVALEIVSDVFLKLWQKRAGFNHLLSIKSFLYTAAKHASLNYLRSNARRQHRRAAFERAFPSEPVPAPVALMIEIEMMRELDQVIRTLPPRCGSVIQFYFIEGLSTREIAERLSVSVSTVDSQRQRGLKLLRAALGSKALRLLLEMLPGV